MTPPHFSAAVYKSDRYYREQQQIAKASAAARLQG